MRRASHWSVNGPGRRGGVGPGARRPPSDHKPEALVERGGSLQLHRRSAGLAAGLLTLALAAPAARRAGQRRPSAIEGATDDAASRRRGLARRPTPVQQARRGRRAPAPARPARSSAATGGDWDGTLLRRLRLLASSGSSARRYPFDARRRLLGVLGQQPRGRPGRLRGRAAGGRRGPVLRRPLHSTRSRRTALHERAGAPARADARPAGAAPARRSTVTVVDARRQRRRRARPPGARDHRAAASTPPPAPTARRP